MLRAGVATIFFISMTFTVAALPITVSATGFDAVADKVYEVTYRLGDNDSKSSARNIAKEKIRKLVLEDVGVYVQRTLTLTETSGGNVDRDPKLKTAFAMAGAVKVSLTGIKERFFFDKNSSLLLHMSAVANVDHEQVDRLVTDMQESAFNGVRMKRLESRLDAVIDGHGNSIMSAQNILGELHGKKGSIGQGAIRLLPDLKKSAIADVEQYIISPIMKDTVIFPPKIVNAVQVASTNKVKVRVDLAWRAPYNKVIQSCANFERTLLKRARKEQADYYMKMHAFSAEFFTDRNCAHLEANFSGRAYYPLKMVAPTIYAHFVFRHESKDTSPYKSLVSKNIYMHRDSQGNQEVNAVSRDTAWQYLRKQKVSIRLELIPTGEAVEVSVLRYGVFNEDAVFLMSKAEVAPETVYITIDSANLPLITGVRASIERD